MARRYYSSTAVATTLSASASNSATSISVTALSGFPNTTPWTAIIDEGTAAEEVVEVTNVSGTTLTVTRGTDGTTGVSHNAGATFKHGVSARDFDEPNAHIANTSNPHAVTAAQAGAVALTAVGAASGVASLDSSGSVPVSQLGNALTSSIALGLQQFAADGSVLANLPAQVPSAERLLKQAVWWIDAAHSTAGEQSVSNLGWGGSALDAQAGSTTGADSNDPKYLDWSGENYVYLPGVVFNSLTVPDEAALDITGDLDIRCRVALDEWTGTSAMIYVAKFSTSEMSFQLAKLNATVTGGGDRIALSWSPTGSTTTFLTAVSTVGTGLAAGEVKWIRATLDVDNGEPTPQYEVRFYLSDDAVTWTQLGTTITGSTGVTSIFASSAELRIGARQFNTAGPLSGKVYRAQVLNGIDGTPVLDIDCSQIGSGSDTSFTALTGQTVTINRSTSGRKAVAVTHPVWLFGTDDYMQVADNDLLDFGASDSFTVLAVVRQWATPVSSGRWLNKRASTGAGWLVAPYATASNLYGFVSDGTDNGDVNPRPSFTLGSVTVGGIVGDRGASTLTSYVNGAASSSTASLSAVDSLANTSVLRVGARSDAVTTVQDMEFVAAAIFRRALTSDEISTLTAYFQGRAI